MSAAQILRQAEALKPSAGDLTKGSTDAWVSRQNLQDLYQKLLIFDLEFALDKKVEQDLWNHAFKNQITVFQNQAKDKVNPKRGDMQSTLQLFLDTASGFYLQLLQEMCSAFKIDLPMRRKPQNYGIVKDIRSGYSRVKMPKKSSSLYICQYCLVHLGDIARYRQQVEQAQTYYRHAAWVVPYNGQPYNQLAILEAAKGNKLSTVFYYIRSAAVKHPFPVACTNLEKFYTKIGRDTKNDFKGKLSMSEMVMGFLQFHALLHQCTDLVKAQTLSDKLRGSFPAHMMSSFSAYQLVQMVAINLFALQHAKRRLDNPPWGGSRVGSEPRGGDEVELQEELSTDEKTSYLIILELTLHMLEAVVHSAPKQESKLKEHHTLPALKLILDWLCSEKDTLNNPSLDKFSTMWQHLAKVLNNLQFMQLDKTQFMEIKKYMKYPLPEDLDLQCFLPLTKAQADYNFQHLLLDGMPEYAEMRIRCCRIVERGLWIAEEFPSLNFLNVQKFSSGRLEFSTSVVPLLHLKLSIAESEGLNEKRPVRQQNVAIQAIIQNKARQSQSLGSLSTSGLHQASGEGGTNHSSTDRAEASKSVILQPIAQREESLEKEEAVGSTVRIEEAKANRANNDKVDEDRSSEKDTQEPTALIQDSPVELKQTTTILKSSSNKTPPNSRRSSKLAVTFETPVEEKLANRKAVASQQIPSSAAGKRGGEKVRAGSGTGSGSSPSDVLKTTKSINENQKGSPSGTPPELTRASQKNGPPSSSTEKIRAEQSRNYYIGVPLTSTEMTENNNTNQNHQGASSVSQQQQPAQLNQQQQQRDMVPLPFALSAFGPISFNNQDPNLLSRQQGPTGGGDAEIMVPPPQHQQQQGMRPPNPATGGGAFPGMMLGPQLPFSMWGGGGGGGRADFHESQPAGPRPRPRLTLAQQRHILQMQHMQMAAAAAAAAQMNSSVPPSRGMCPAQPVNNETRLESPGETGRQGPWNPSMTLQQGPPLPSSGQHRNPWGPGQEWTESPGMDPGGVRRGNHKVKDSENCEDFSPRPGGAVRGKGPQYPQPPRPIGPSANQLPQPQFTAQMQQQQQHPEMRMTTWETRQPPGDQFENLHPTLQQLFQTAHHPGNPDQPNAVNIPHGVGPETTPPTAGSVNNRDQAHFQGGNPDQGGVGMYGVEAHPDMRRLSNGMDIPKPSSPSGSSSGMGSLFSTTPETRGQTPPNSGMYSLFSNSPWSLPLNKPDTNGQSPSPFGSSTASNRTSPEHHAMMDDRSPNLAPGQPINTVFGGPASPPEQPVMWQMSSPPEMRMNRPPPNVPMAPPDLMANNMQTLWSGPSALARLLESQRPQKQRGDPH